MELLFRLPLLEFDIRDSKEIKKRWPELLDAIRLSSTTLFDKIRDRQPEELNSSEKKSVYRYLLRGRYRATPFGKWAAVGVADWIPPTHVKKEKVDLSTKSIEVHESAGASRSYRLNSSLSPWADGWKFWNFDFATEQWRYSKSADSPLIQELRKLSYYGECVSKERLFKAFPGLLQVEKDAIWKHLTEQQLITSGESMRVSHSQRKEDHFIPVRPGLNNKYKENLKTFFSDIGRLAVPQENTYLQSLTDRFLEEFDDRFVPLNMLWKIVPYLVPHTFESKNGNPDGDTFLSQLDRYSRLDLRKLEINTGESLKINHTQALFRVLENGQILIDNLVFNRPFVYGGRFTHQPEIFNYYNNQFLQSEDVLYADVILAEGMKAQHLSCHKSITPLTLNCLSHSSEANELDTTTTYIGFHQGKFILMAPKWEKQIIPIFQHPLNPQYITHPLCRILWEVAHQDLVKPIHYSQHQFTSAEYLPQLEWGNIILQPRQWRIKWNERYRNDQYLSGALLEKGIPTYVLVGYQDQELALDLSHEADRSVLMEELRKGKSVHIQEWLWKKMNINSGEEESQYPQYVYGQAYNSPIPDCPPAGRVNYILEPYCKEWLSARIILCPDFQESVIRYQLALFFDEVKASGILPYYYLFYRLKNAEIRVRCKVKTISERGKVVTLLHYILGNNGDVDHIKITPYYPEFVKYSKPGMIISEELFHQESELILLINASSDQEKKMMAVGIGSLYFSDGEDTDYWIDALSKLSKGKTSHKATRDIKGKFERTVSKEWQNKYHALVRKHPWYRDQEKKAIFIANQIHMLINRIFWDEGLKMEQEIYCLLGSMVREMKYGKPHAGRQVTDTPDLS